MINSALETQVLARAETWHRFFDQVRGAASEDQALQTHGLLVRVAGLVLEAAGLRQPVGSVCEVRMPGQAPVLAEVVGFSGDRAFLMPTGDVHGLVSGARVVPRGWPPQDLGLGNTQHRWRRS
jgi:flagellum-specific ATP synthase